MRIGLVFGGNTAEGNVSKQTAECVRGALNLTDKEVINIEYNKNIATNIQDANIDVVFNAMHGQYGEDGCLQGLLNIMQIPYTHSGVTASAIGMNKFISNNIFRSINIPTIRSIVVTKQDLYNGNWKEIIKYSDIAECKEFFVKPIASGSSVDTFLIHDINQFTFETIELSESNNLFLIQERIIGKEVQVAIVNNNAIGMLEIVPNKSEFFDYKAKYSENGAMHQQLDESDEIKNKLLTFAKNAHDALGCNCVSRVDFLLTNEKNIRILEINTHPGLTSLSILPDIARKAGIEYEDIIEILLKNAKFGS